MEYSELIAARYSVRAYRPDPVEDVVSISVERGVQVKPHPILPQMPKTTEFGEGVCKMFMKIEITTKVEIVLPPFSSRRFSRDANGGTRRGQECRVH